MLPFPLGLGQLPGKFDSFFRSQLAKELPLSGLDFPGRPAQPSGSVFSGSHDAKFTSDQGVAGTRFRLKTPVLKALV
jgi:hypothetical protein